MIIYDIYGNIIFGDDNDTAKGALENAVNKGINLSCANLSYANLRFANLINANLQKANLINANLEDASLFNAILEDANLYRVNLQRADLRNANLKNTNLYNADLRRANLQNSNLKNANFLSTNIPLWCGSFDIDISIEFIYNLLYHICMFKNDSVEFKEIKSLIVKYANKWTGIKEHSLKEINE